MQFLDNAPYRNTKIFLFSLVMLLALGVFGFSLAVAKSSSTNAATGQASINGVWAGEIIERDTDGNPKSHGTLYLRLEQSGNGIKGVIGENEASASPIESAALVGNHLKFSAQAPGGPKGPVTWILDLNIQGDEMTGKGHAFRKADNHSWDADARFLRQK
jgi:hypothetical protein